MARDLDRAPTWVIAKTFGFSAAHHLELLPDSHKCHRNHGHNFTVTLVLTAEFLSQERFIVDYGDLAGFKAWVDETLDHQDLNDVLLMSQPTAEALAAFVHSAARGFPFGPFVHTVVIQETEKTMAAYTERGAPIVWTA